MQKMLYNICYTYIIIYSTYIIMYMYMITFMHPHEKFFCVFFFLYVIQCLVRK